MDIVLLRLFSYKINNLHAPSSAVMFLKTYLSSLTSRNTWEDINKDFIKVNEQKYNNNVINSLQKDISSNRKKKKYILSMLPYPSGKLHMDHVRVYTMADAVARYYYMKGYEVLHPMGWDAFGLPAENAAIEIGKNPDDWTSSNISNMKKQLNELGCCFDWSRELATCDPKYYKWTQLLFLKLYKAGLAYRKEAVVNWDPVDKTVLANEQVNAKGISWRSGAKVEKKHLKQWFIKTTRYAKDLYEDLNHLPQESWEMVSGIQKHWIGECNGYAIELKLVDTENNEIEDNDKLPVWMANPEELVNVNFLSVPSGHILVQEKYLSSVQEHIKILSVFATEPISQKRLPIIVCDDVDYVQDCQVYAGIPRLNKKDKHLCSICGFSETNHNLVDLLNVDSMSNVRETLLKRLSELGCGGYETSARLRDWLISRQRYWGTPIPIIYCGKCGTIPVPETDLPVTLPEVKGFINKGAAVLKEVKEWYNCQCPSCGGPATREIDTMDTFVDSSWYFLRYLDVNNDTNLVSKEKADYYMPVDLYIGSKQHAESYLSYARFMTKFLKDDGILSHSEPFFNILLSQVNEGSVAKNHSNISGKVNIMSTNFQNSIETFGVDVVRLYFITKNNPNEDFIWSEEDIATDYKFIEKVYNAIKTFVTNRSKHSSKLGEKETSLIQKQLFTIRNNYIRIITNNFERFRLLNVRQNLQEFFNDTMTLGQAVPSDVQLERNLRDLVLMTTPFCPHICAHLWFILNSESLIPEMEKDTSVFEEEWPVVDSTFPINLECQVNFEKIYNLKIPYSKFSSLDEESAVSLMKGESEVYKILYNLSVIEVEFTNSDIKPALNFITIPRKNILRELECIIKDEVITLKISQNEFKTLDSKKAHGIAMNSEKVRRYLTGYVVKEFKFNHIPNGKSRIKFDLRRFKPLIDGVPPRGKRL